MTNAIWHDFLTKQQATFLEHGDINVFNSHQLALPYLCPLTQFGVLLVAGEDAEIFLQGQLTCNVKELEAENSFFSALCNSKGQVISTLLIFKHECSFLLIMPVILLPKVKATLQRYVLRSKVSLQDVTDEFCLLGIGSVPEDIVEQYQFPLQNFARRHNVFKIPVQRYLLCADAETCIDICQSLLGRGFGLQHIKIWDYLDISAKLAWLDEGSSGHYIPQMLNLDQWGGVSFNKGCYTGQEVVSRTHYLGKVKRGLCVAETEIDVSADADPVVNEQGESVGNVLKAVSCFERQKLLLVLQTSALGTSELRLNSSQHKIRLCDI